MPTAATLVRQGCEHLKTTSFENTETIREYATIKKLYITPG